MRRFSAVLGLQLLTFSLPPLVLIPTRTSAQITHNLEIIWQKSYVDGAAPDSLWGWGRSIASAGDVNGDGFDDIIVGANTRDTVPLNPWVAKAYIFFGGASIDTTPDVVLTGTDAGTQVMTISSIGDFNMDSFDDVVVAQGDPYQGLNGVRVFYGGDPMDAVPDLILETRPGYSLAHAVACAGDVNGDTHDDCIAGDYSYNGNVGRATIFFGGPSADNLPDVILNGESVSNFGISVSGAGDVGGDGFYDVMVGAPDYGGFPGGTGKVYLYFGGSPMNSTPDVEILGQRAGALLGRIVTDVNDHNYDSYDDVAIGTQWPGKQDTVLLFLGSDTMDNTADQTFQGETGSNFGGTVAGAGRADSGDYADMIVGAARWNGDRGKTYLFLGDSTLDTTPDASAEGEYPDHQPGWVVASAGDMDRDGVDEIVFSNYACDSVKTVWVAKYTGTGVEEQMPYAIYQIPAVRSMQNWPNPFGAGGTNISFSVNRVPCHVSLKIYDTLGRRVRTLLDNDPISDFQSPVSVLWDGRDDEGMEVRSGIYFYRLTVVDRASTIERTRKLVLMR